MQNINFIKDSPAPLAILDKEFKIIGCSNFWILEHFENSDKYKTPEDILNLSFVEIHKTPKKLINSLKHCLKGHYEVNLGEKFTYDDGKNIWYKWKINNRKNEAGQVIGLIVLLEDVTDAKNKEELLLNAKTIARIGGWEVNFVKDELYWTDVTREILETPDGYIPTVPKAIDFYQEGFSRDRITQHMDDAVNLGKPFDDELPIVTAKGNVRWVRVLAEAEFVDNTCVRISGAIQDIDEKKWAELEYQTLSDRLAVATNAAKIGIWEYNVIEDILIWDDNMHNIYGTSKSMFSNNLNGWSSTCHPDDLEQTSSLLQKVINGKRSFSTTFRIILPNKKIKHLKGEGRGKKDSAGNTTHVIGANWDITEEVESNQKLKHLLDISSEQNKSLLNFAHIVSHNLRSHSSNLTMLAGFLTKETNPDEKVKLLQMLTHAASSLNETVLHLNEVVQVKTTPIDKMKPIKLLKTIKNVEQNLSLIIKDKGAKINTHIDAQMILMAIPAYLDSILLNLFTNSLKYSAKGRTPEIIIKGVKNKKNTIITFADNGIGIDLERHKHKIFGMYKTFTRNKDAKGIGLFITKNQIEAMSGTIEVESTPNIGTTFTLTFNN